MKGKYLFAFMVAGILLFTAVALGTTCTKYDEVNTKVIMDSDITCTINGKTVSNGQTVSVNPNFSLVKICVSSEYDLPIGVAGVWNSDGDTVTASSTDDSIVRSGEVRALFGHGTYDGTLRVFFTADDSDLADIILTFTIDSRITVRSQGVTINNGDQFTFHGDSTINVITNDGQRHDISYSGSWSNDCGMSSGASGSELGSDITIYIEDFIYFDPAYGTMKISI